jgi:MFS family permease
MKLHPMLRTLLNFKGNARGCVYTEALNGIPNSLLVPYLSVYMLALGLNDQQIGAWLSVGWIFQLIMAVFGGVITDKLGRRKTSLVFDILAWTIPAIIYAFAQTYWHFLAGAVMASFLRVAANSWTCLMVEDAEADDLLDIFAWIQIMCLLSAFFVPLAGLLVKRFDLIPAVRMMYIFAAIMFTLKAFLTYFMTTETRQGLVRMEQTKNMSLFSSLKEYDGVVKILISNPASLITMGIMTVMSISTTINNTFWSVIVTEKIGIPAENIAYYPFAKSAVMLLFFFFVIPWMKQLNFKKPMMIGFSGFLLSQLILVLVPQVNYGVLLVSILLEACSLAAVTPLVDQMTIVTMDAKERARIQSILYVAVILITSPFGWIAGQLSSIDRAYPFVLNMVLLAVGVFLAYLAGKVAERKSVVPAVEVG